MVTPARVGHGMDRSIARGGQAIVAKTGAESQAKAFAFPWAGGFIGGSAGTYTVYCSTDGNPYGNGDPYQELVKDGTAVEVEVIAGKKNIIPDEMFNCGWTKLVGPAGEVRLFGAG